MSNEDAVPSLTDEKKSAAITACALMIKGICLTTPNEEWTERIENRIHYLLRQITTAPTAEQVEAVATQAARDVLAERQRQMSAEGWTAAHDDEHDEGEMASAAAAYAAHSCGWNDSAVRDLWPPQWHLRWLKTSTPRRDLVKAGALILAEIERIDRATTASSTGEQA